MKGRKFSIFLCSSHHTLLIRLFCVKKCVKNATNLNLTSRRVKRGRIASIDSKTFDSPWTFWISGRWAYPYEKRLKNSNWLRCALSTFALRILLMAIQSWFWVLSGRLFFTSRYTITILLASVHDICQGQVFCHTGPGWVVQSRWAYL